jgi:outer membrane protein TolC
MKQNAARNILIALIALGSFPVFSQQAETTSAPNAQTAESPAALPAVGLDDAVSAAMTTSPNLKLTAVALDTARAALVQGMAKDGVTVGETGDYSHQGGLGATTSASTASSLAAGAASGGDLSGENIKGGISLTGPSTSLGITAQHSMVEGASSDQVSGLVLSGSQTIFDGYPGGQGVAALQEARAAYTIAQIAHDAAVKNTIYLVKQAYYTLLGDQDTVTLRQATVEQAKENLTLYQGLYTAQKATTLDVLQVQVALTQAQLDVRTARNTVASDRKKLSQAIGWPLDKQYSVADRPPPDLPLITSDDALATAMKNRSEILTLDQNVAAAGIALLLQKSQAMPVISLKASVGVGQDWTANVNNGSIAAGLSIALPPVYDGGLQNALVQQENDALSTYAVQRDQERQSIAIDVENALFNVTDTHDRNALAAQSLEQAQGQYDFEKEKLAVGLGTTLDELTAFSTLATARVALEQAKINYLLAILNLDNVMGL